MIELPSGLTVERFLHASAAMRQAKRILEAEGRPWPSLEERCQRMEAEQERLAFLLRKLGEPRL